jgi:hypothetical protein
MVRREDRRGGNKAKQMFGIQQVKCKSQRSPVVIKPKTQIGTAICIRDRHVNSGKKEVHS